MAKKRDDKPLSWFGNRLGIFIVITHYMCNVWWAIRNNEMLPEWTVVAYVTAIAAIIATPNESADKMINKNYQKESNKYRNENKEHEDD